jgi:hypothetical protein
VTLMPHFVAIRTCCFKEMLLGACAIGEPPRLKTR